MAAPTSLPFSSSTSSSGHVDGLGRRSLSFDRETGAILERLHLRPELAAFESLLRQRVTSLSTLEDERFARPNAIERDPATGELTILSEFVTGSRLSDLLETSADTSVVPGVDVALGYLLETLPALSVLHRSHRAIHGLIHPSRTVLTAEGQVVLLDVAFGGVIEKLRLSNARLWSDFGIAPAVGAGSMRFDQTADVTQVALSALTLVLGRNLRQDEYPDALASLLMEVIEVAQIRGSASFATSLQRFFQRSLPLPGRRAYTMADEALVDTRLLVRQIGADACRQAIVDFVEQMEAAYSDAPPSSAAPASFGGPSPMARAASAAAGSRFVPELESFLDHVGTDHSHAALDSTSQLTDTGVEERADDEGVELEISLDNLDAPPVVARAPKAEADEIYDLSSIDMADLAMAEAALIAPTPRKVMPSIEERPPVVATAPVHVEEAPPMVVEPPPLPEPFVETPAPAPLQPPAVELASAVGGVEPSASFVVDSPPPVAIPEPASMPEPPAAIAEPASAIPAPEPVAAPASEHYAAEDDGVDPQAETSPEKDTPSSRRKKRQQQKSARARKDKLRSTTVSQKLPPPPPAEPPKAPSPSGWLVSPQRSAAFDPPVPQPAPIAPPPRPVPSVPSFSPTLVAALPQPVYAPQTPAPIYGSPTPPVAPPVARRVAPPAPAPAVLPVKLKVESPSGFAQKPATLAEPRPVSTVGTLASFDSDATDEKRGFPWKLAAIAVGVAIVAIVAGRAYLPGRAAVAGEPGAQAATTTPPPAPAPAPAPDDSAEAVASGRGRLVITTQPPGIKVLIDRKPAGETPLKIDVPPGKRMLTFQTAGGEVLRSVKVVAGKTVTLDIPVFSGWLAIFAPIVLDIAENGRSLGTTEQSRLMLPPGKHSLTFSNKDLGYSTSQDVDIDAGAVKSVNLEPKGTASLNAAPWAEVWLDGQKLGDTPLTSSVTLGLHEFVFKHPQKGERRVSATIKAGAPSPVSVDFNK
jgi:serine/threonine protein kinase